VCRTALTRKWRRSCSKSASPRRKVSSKCVVSSPISPIPTQPTFCLPCSDLASMAWKETSPDSLSVRLLFLQHTYLSLPSSDPSGQQLQDSLSTTLSSRLRRTSRHSLVSDRAVRSASPSRPVSSPRLIFFSRPRLGRGLSLHRLGLDGALCISVVALPSRC
jgi:hypothetical protein